MEFVLGKRIRELRLERGVSQVELANATGLSQSAISAWEVGSNIPTADVLVILATYFNVSSDYLVGLSDKI